MAELVRALKLFGSRRRTEVLLLVSMLGETYPTEVARLLGAKYYSVYVILDQLTSEGVLVTRKLGRVLRVQLNPRFHAAKELKQLLWKLAEEEPRIRRAAASRRSRPRRRGKNLDVDS